MKADSADRDDEDVDSTRQPMASGTDLLQEFRAPFDEPPPPPSGPPEPTMPSSRPPPPLASPRKRPSETEMVSVLTPGVPSAPDTGRSFRLGEVLLAVGLVVLMVLAIGGVLFLQGFPQHAR